MVFYTEENKRSITIVINPFGAGDGILVRFATEPLPIYACPSQDGRTRFSPETPLFSRRDSGGFAFLLVTGCCYAYATQYSLTLIYEPRFSPETPTQKNRHPKG